MSYKIENYNKILEYLKIATSTDIEDIEKLEKNIKKLYPKDHELYIELSNYYTRNNKIEKSISNLEKYKENAGSNIDVLMLLAKQYLQINSVQKFKELLNVINVDSKHKKEIKELLCRVEKIDNEKEADSNKNIEYNNNFVENIFKDNAWDKDINQVIFYNNDIVDKILYDLVIKSISLNVLSKNKIIKFIYLKIRYHSVLDSIIKLSRDNSSIYKLIDFICCIIELDDTNFSLIGKLSEILDCREFDEKNKNSIIEILTKYYECSKSVRAKNIFLNEIEILQNKTILQSRPTEIHITLTLKCNLKCIMCCNGYNKEYEINNSVYNYLIDNIKYLSKVIWKGGEVFLYKNFMNLLKIASQNRVNQVIITNGLLLNEYYVDFFAKNNVSLSISIDAIDKKLYEKIRVGGKFEKLLENLELLKKAKEENDKFNYNMNVVLMNNNYEQIKDFIDFALFYRFSGISFLDCDKSEESKNRYLILNKEQIQYVYKQYKEKEKELKDNKSNLIINFDIPLQFCDQTYKNDICCNEEKGCKEKKIVENVEEKNNLDNNNKSRFERNFCTLPWRRLIIDENDVSFGCQCRNIDISKYNICEDDVWNCEELVKYRDNILKYKEKSCKIFIEKNNSK